MNDHRQRLLTFLARPDQQLAEAASIVADLVDSENVPMAEELREMLVEMQANVEEKLDGAEA